MPGGTGNAATCVLYVDVPVGTTALRVYADKRSLVPLLAKGTKVFAGWALNSKPKAVASGSVTGSASNRGDVMLTVDVSGQPGKWWVLVESEDESDVWVSAVAYDIGQRPRVSVELGRRTGVIAVESGAAQIFRVQLPANKATTLNINIDAGWIGTIGQNYDVYANILDDKKIQMITDNLSITSVFDFLSKLAKAFQDGKIDALFPKYLTPSATNKDFQGLGHIGNFGKVSIPIPSSQQAPLVYVAIQPQTNLPWSGALSSFTVQFSTPEASPVDTFDTATCENPSKRRDVADAEQAADPCAGSVCRDCAARSECHFCLGESVPSQGCRSKSNACPAKSAPATVAQCSECVSLVDDSACGGNAACTWCSTLSVGDIVTGCTHKFSCPAQEAKTAPASTTAPASVAPINAATSTAASGAPVDATTSDAVAVAVSVLATALAVALLF